MLRNNQAIALVRQLGRLQQCRAFSSSNQVKATALTAMLENVGPSHTANVVVLVLTGFRLDFVFAGTGRATGLFLRAPRQEPSLRPR